MYMAWLIYGANLWREISVTVDQNNAVLFRMCRSSRIGPLSLSVCVNETLVVTRASSAASVSNGVK